MDEYETTPETCFLGFQGTVFIPYKWDFTVPEKGWRYMSFRCRLSNYGHALRLETQLLGEKKL